MIVNHFNSKGGDDPLRGRFQPPVESERDPAPPAGTARRQLRLADLGTADASANVIVLGDLNDFEFSQTVQILETAGLHDLMETLPQNERYSYEFEGNAQVLDHIMVSGAAARAAARLRPGARQRGVLRPGSPTTTRRSCACS